MLIGAFCSYWEIEVGQGRESGVHVLTDLLLADNHIQQHFTSSVVSQSCPLQSPEGTEETQWPLRPIPPGSPPSVSPLEPSPMPCPWSTHVATTGASSFWTSYLLVQLLLLCNKLPPTRSINQQTSYARGVFGSGIQRGQLSFPMMSSTSVGKTQMSRCWNYLVTCMFGTWARMAEGSAQVGADLWLLRVACASHSMASGL